MMARAKCAYKNIWTTSFEPITSLFLVSCESCYVEVYLPSCLVLGILLGFSKYVVLLESIPLMMISEHRGTGVPV